MTGSGGPALPLSLGSCMSTSEGAGPGSPQLRPTPGAPSAPLQMGLSWP